MPPTTRARLAGVLVLFALSPGVAAQRGPQPESRAGLIVGQVVDGSNGRPIGGAIVSISGAGPVRPAPGESRTLPRILTGADGRFLFRDLPRGSFGISAEKPGYAPGAYGRRRPGGASLQIALADGERRGDVLVRVWRHGAITGRVIDEAGEPLVSVRLRAFRRAVLGGGRRFTPAATAQTDDRGIYRFGSLTPGEYLVAVISRPVAVPVELLSGWHVAPIPGLAGSGQLPGSTAALGTGDTSYLLGPGSAIPPPPGAGRLFAYPTTFHPAASLTSQAVPITVASGEDRQAVDLQLRPVPTARVAGILQKHDGIASGVPLHLVPADGADAALDQDAAVAIANVDGRFEFPAVPAGRYTLRAETAAGGEPGSGQRTPALLWTAIPLSVGHEDITGLAVMLQPALRVTGRIEFDGRTASSAKSVAQIPLAIEPADGMPRASSAPQSVRVGGGGEFVSAGVPAGRYIVRVTGSPAGWMFHSATFEGRDISIEPIELRGGDATGVIVRFTDRWTGVQGLVQDGRGEPDADATVVLFPAEEHAWTGYGPNPRRLRSARTSQDGTYSINAVPPGDYYVAALPDEDAGDWQDPEHLTTLSRGATHVRVHDGERPTQNLRTRPLR